MTDALCGLTGGKVRYFDLIRPEPVRQDTRTADEIIDHICGKLEEVG